LILTDPPRASRMQQSLIRYLRAAMPQMRSSGNGARPTLGQQVELSRAFLEIMAVRMEDRLRTEVQVPEGLKSAVFPSMMLQTLVENAIRHGLEPRAEGGRLAIRAEIADGKLSVQVCDTGVGFSFGSKGGVGLANIRERLKVIYKDRAELVISVPAEGGTCATITVPYEVATPAQS
jgi:LytS/YehU family sensor histidine kinase